MNSSKFSLGDTVQVIDRNEDSLEWAVFTISSIEDDRFLLIAPDGEEPLEPFWIRDEQIVPVFCQTME